MPEGSRRTLGPLLSSVGEARAMVGRLADRVGLDPEVAGDAALVVSELVTNAVLHAGTTLEVAVLVVDDPGWAVVRIEVTDGGAMPLASLDAAPPPAAPPAAPVAFDDPAGDDLDDAVDELATTGRGMELVGSLAARWGVEAHREGKTVWAELRAAPPPAAQQDPAARQDPALRQDPPLRQDPAPPPAAPAAQQVRLVAAPMRLITESDRNFDDTIRELQVIALSRDVDPEVGELARLATSLQAELGPVRHHGHEEVRAARQRGDRLVDVHLSVGPDTARQLQTLDQLLSAIAAARSTERLLVLGPAPEVVAFRLWYRDEVLRQLAGEAPQPCPFPSLRPDTDPSGREAHHAGAAAPLSDRRRGLLAALAAEVAAATDPAAVARTALARVIADTGAAFANLLLVDPADGHVATLERVGYPPGDPEGRRYPVSADNPISEVVRTARPLVLRTQDERRDRYPLLVPSEPVAANPTAVWLPLGRQPPAMGTLVVGFGRSRDFTDGDLHHLLEVAEVIRARLARVPG